MRKAEATRRDLLLAFRGRHDAPAPSAAADTLDQSPSIAVIGPGCLNQAGTICEACRDVCATRAIRAIPRLRQAPIVAVREADCTGCGDCVSACPVSAITLAGAAHA